MSLPPETLRRPAVEHRFGADVSDPYRWLEADLATDPDVLDWMAQQDRYAHDVFDALPGRNAMRHALETAWSFEKLSTPARHGDRYFSHWNPGVANHAVVQVQDALDGAPRTLVDPNEMDPGGGIVVSDWLPSHDGALLAYTVQRDGVDWRSLHVMDVTTGALLSDRIDDLKGPLLAWAPDGSGLYYTAFARVEGAALTAATLDSTTRFHRLGTATADDPVVFEGARSVLHWPRVSDDGRWLVVSSSNGGMNREEIRVQDRTRADAPMVALIAGATHRWNFLGGRDDALYFFTDHDAVRGRVVSLDPTGDATQVPRTIVPERDDAIRGVVLAGDEVVVQYVVGTDSIVRRYGRDGVERPPIAVPPGMVVDQLRGTPHFAEVFFRLSSMVSPPAVHRFDLASGTSSTVRAPAPAWDPSRYVVRQIRATSPDGTRFPITLAHARDIDPSAPQPTALLVYGGFGITLDMGFAETRFAWILGGGVFAVAHVRGGAEYGAEWAAASRKGGRLKVIEDYLAAARAVCDAGLASHDTLVAIGASNGGLIVSAATNADPAAFAVTLARVPVADMLRYTEFTWGRLWIEELGDPDVEDEFRALLAYSPVHNVRSGRRYPAMIVTTATSDDRAVPAHAFKLVATLQHADIGPGPHVLRIDRGTGHGQGKPARLLLDEFVDLWSFARAHLAG